MPLTPGALHVAGDLFPLTQFVFLLGKRREQGLLANEGYADTGSARWLQRIRGRAVLGGPVAGALFETHLVLDVQGLA